MIENNQIINGKTTDKCGTIIIFWHLLLCRVLLVVGQLILVSMGMSYAYDMLFKILKMTVPAIVEFD